MRYAQKAVCLAVALTASGCASSGGSDGPRRDRNVIVAEELTDFSHMNLMDAINQLRPQWLRTRGAPSLEFGGDQAVRVVIDRGAPQDWLILNSLRSTDVVRLEFVNSRDATMRWGTGYPNGVIEVFTN